MNNKDLDEVKLLKQEILKFKEALSDQKENILSDIARNKDVTALKSKLIPRRHLVGHFGKIYAFDWGPDSLSLVSAGQDGNLFVWDLIHCLKIQAQILRSAWVMAAGFAPSGNLLASGGLDNLCTIYKYQEGATFGVMEGVICELPGHEGYLSSCTFIDDEKIFTTSGDHSCALWNIGKEEKIQSFNYHDCDVTCGAKSPIDSNIFVTGSIDSQAVLWDIRIGNKPVQTFIGHDSDVNSVTFFPNGNAIVTGSDDSVCRLYDFRSYSVLNKYVDERLVSGVSSLATSKSGRAIFASYDDGPLVSWDAVYADVVQHLAGHENRVSCVRMAPDGSGLCTSSWDESLMVWV